MVLVIDNYDSFTYNLVQYLGEMQVEMQVHRNDQISVEQIRALNPERILISPGPCSPKESGLSNEIPHVQFANSYARGLFGTSVHWACLWRERGGELPHDARQDFVN